MDMFRSVSFFITLATAISKSSCAGGTGSVREIVRKSYESSHGGSYGGSSYGSLCGGSCASGAFLQRLPSTGSAARQRDQECEHLRNSCLMLGSTLAQRLLSLGIPGERASESAGRPRGREGLGGGGAERDGSRERDRPGAGLAGSGTGREWDWPGLELAGSVAGWERDRPGAASSEPE